MYPRIIWGKIKDGQWAGFEEAYKTGITATHDVPYLQGRWHARDIDNPNAGFSIRLWEDEKSMRAYLESPDFKERRSRWSSRTSSISTP